jgi:hypothetical protein
MKYIDTSAGLYTENYPIVSLSKSDTFEYHTHDLRRLFETNIWFKLANTTEQNLIISKLKNIIALVDDIVVIITKHYPNKHIKHISLGGSYLFKTSDVNDIDFNVIVAGSHFSYLDIYDINAINEKLLVKVKKISLMIFGEDDFFHATEVKDTIEVEDYIHTSLCMREGLVFPLRNVPLFGYLCEPRSLDTKNLIVRIKRQLYHAKLMLENKVDLHRSIMSRLQKSIGRISEAMLLLSVIFPKLKISSHEIVENEKDLLRTLQPEKVSILLDKANDYIKSLE